jgi:uncharacterized protein (DUF4415 family)
MESDDFFDDENPEWTEEDFKRARPLSEVSPELYKALVRPKGRPVLDSIDHKQAVSIRLHRDIIAHFKADGPGWQTRLNLFLLQALEKTKKQTSAKQQ